MGSKVLTKPALVPCAGFGDPESQWGKQYNGEQLRPGILQQPTSSQIHISIKIKVLNWRVEWRRIVWLWSHLANTVLWATIHYNSCNM